METAETTARAGPPRSAVVPAVFSGFAADSLVVSYHYFRAQPTR